MKTFLYNVNEFIRCDKHTFLTQDKTGDGETFYTHALKCYIPTFVKVIWNCYKCGYGIFTMQGFEHRNKESKFLLVNFSNQKGNVAVNNVDRLQDAYTYIRYQLVFADVRYIRTFCTSLYQEGCKFGHNLHHIGSEYDRNKKPQSSILCWYFSNGNVFSPFPPFPSWLYIDFGTIIKASSLSTIATNKCVCVYLFTNSRTMQRTSFWSPITSLSIIFLQL